MNITKFGQCCLLIEVSDKRILTDPGRFTSTQNDVANIDLILITHEHPDHLHTESLQAILKKNPQARVVTNTSVGTVLAELGIPYEILEGRDSANQAGIALEAYDGKHAEIFEEYGQVQNTGYFIAEQLFYPGDAYTEPGKSVPVLALPAGGPWCTSADTIAYALRIKPEAAFPVHDYLWNEEGITLMHGLLEKQLTDREITFVRMVDGDTQEF